MKRAAVLCVALLGPGLAPVEACAHQRVHAHKSFVQCPLAGPTDQPLLAVFDNAKQWQAVMQAGEQAGLGRAVRWNKERVVVFALERQPTLGVHVELDAARVAASRGRLVLPVSVRRPGPGELAATALSRPCVIAAVLRGGWRKAAVTDPEGRVLARQVVSAAANR